MKIAVSAYSYSQYYQNGKMTQFDAVSKAKKMGFDAIEYTELVPFFTLTYQDQVDYAKKIRAEADRLNFPIIGYLISGSALYAGSEEGDRAVIERLKKEIDIAEILGAKFFRHDICGGEKFNGKTVSFAKQLPIIAKNAREVADYAASKGIVSCSENHGLIGQDSDRLEALYNAVDHENFGLLVDMGNFICADENPATAVSRIAPYAVHAHAKDFYLKPFGEPAEGYYPTRGCNQFQGCAVGDGEVPVAQCVKTLQKAGYDEYLTIEFEGPGDCIDELYKGLAFLRECSK